MVSARPSGPVGGLAAMHLYTPNGGLASFEQAINCVLSENRRTPARTELLNFRILTARFEVQTLSSIYLLNREMPRTIISFIVH